jgi:thiamine biosynthesis lipoprotein
MALPVLKASTFTCMGTVVSVTMPAAAVRAATASGRNETADALGTAAAAVERVFAGLDARFSLYRPDSEASRLARGDIQLREASAEMRERYADAAGWRLLTGGAFTPERPDGILDLSGTIKGYAIRRAGAALQDLGLVDWCLNAGGDVLVAGSPAPGSGAPWQTGIVDPADRTGLATAFPLGGTSRFTALATSGSAERGDHIWTAGAGRAEFVQVSVAATDIVTADVLATAIVAGGRQMLDRATDDWDIEVLATLADGVLLGTQGFRAPTQTS